MRWDFLVSIEQQQLLLAIDHLVLRMVGGLCKLRPLPDGFAQLFDRVVRGRNFCPPPVRLRQQVFDVESLKLTVFRHQVLAGPFTRGIVSEGDVVGRCEFPGWRYLREVRRRSSRCFTIRSAGTSSAMTCRQSNKKSSISSGSRVSRKFVAIQDMRANFPPPTNFWGAT